MTPSEKRMKHFADYLNKQSEINERKELIYKLNKWLEDHIPPHSPPEAIVNGLVIAEIKRLLRELDEVYGIRPPRN